MKTTVVGIFLAILLAPLAHAEAPVGDSAAPGPGKCPPYADGRKADASPVVDAIDTNHDGKMTHEEWQAAGAPEPSWQSFMRKPEVAHQGYITRSDFLNDSPPPGIDTDCDGDITLKEFLATKLWKMGPPPGAANPCDRQCLMDLGNKLLDSMPAHASDRLPLSLEYAATENSVPAALNMMTIWRTASAVHSRYFAIDPVSHQLFFEASVGEAGNDTFVFGRLLERDLRIAEVEVYENRSRAQGGFQYGAAGPANLPVEWTQSIDKARRPNREQLARLARSIFDAAVDSPDASPDCVLMENGKVVAENADVAAKVGGGEAGRPKGKAYVTNADGSVPIPCGSPPGRPTDALARTPIIDEEQGVVVALAQVQGATEPYLATSPTESAFVPFAMLKSYTDMLASQRASGLHPQVPRLIAMAASAAVMQPERMYDGKVQGMQLLVNLGAPGAHSPWVPVASKD